MDAKTRELLEYIDKMREAFSVLSVDDGEHGTLFWVLSMCREFIVDCVNNGQYANALSKAERDELVQLRESFRRVNVRNMEVECELATIKSQQDRDKYLGRFGYPVLWDAQSTTSG